MARETSEDPVRQAGGVVFRRIDGRTEFLILTPRDRRTWIFPKGHVEAGESDVDAALREVLEESGVAGAAVATLDPPHRFRSAGEDVVVRYVLVCALRDGEPEAGREKRWVAAEEALVLLAQPETRQLILTAHHLLEQISILARPERFADLALAEHHHLSRLLAQRERTTEHRVLGLVLVLVAAAAFPSVEGVVGLSAVLLFGLLTFGKVVDDRRVREGYRDSLRTLGRSFVPAAHDPRRSLLPFDPHGEARPRTVFGSVSRGGALPTVILIDGALAGGLAAAAMPEPTILAAGIGVATSLVLGVVAHRSR